jgi:flagellar protein FliS
MNPAAHRSARAYASVGFESRADGSGPHEVVTLLFEGLLERIQLSKLALEQRDVDNKIRHINKALQILGEGLRTHLDTKAGGELAQQLDSLYAYCSVRLLDANAHNDAAALDEVHGLLKPVADAWRECRPPSGAPGAHAFAAAAAPASASPAKNETATYPPNPAPSYGSGRSGGSSLGGALLRYAA